MVKLIELTAGHFSLGIMPEIGGSLAWYRECGESTQQDWLRAVQLPASNQAASTDAGAMACFPLFPYSNRIRNGQFSFNGQHVQLPATEADPHFEHGHGWRQPWIVEYQDQTRAALLYRHQPDSWPWSYEARQNIVLYEDRLEITLSITNCSLEAMPFGMGLHPFFPVIHGVYIETSVNSMWQVDSDVLPVGSVALSEAEQRIEVEKVSLDNVFGGWSRFARIVWPEQGASLDILAQEPLNFLVLYTPEGEQYFCAEPVGNATDAFNLSAIGTAETGLMVLSPAETKSATVRFIPRVFKAVAESCDS